MPKQKKETFYCRTWEKTQPVNEIWPVYIILQKKKCYQNILQKLQPENKFEVVFEKNCPIAHFLLENETSEASYLN